MISHIIVPNGQQQNKLLLVLNSLGIQKTILLLCNSCAACQVCFNGVASSKVLCWEAVIPAQNLTECFTRLHKRKTSF